MGNWAIGIDIGGTFTDLVALDFSAGRMQGLKLLTTHGDPSDAVIDGLRRLIEQCAIAPADIDRVVHATTLFTNALIERRGSPTGLLATRGFADAIEIGNERKYDLYDLTIDAFPPLVPRSLRAESGGRLDAQGQEIEPVERAGVLAAVADLVDRGVESLAVSLLHSYASPIHERRVGAWIAEAFPRLDVTLSSEVAPVIREYERTSTAVANAYIRPLAKRYLDTLRTRLAGLGVSRSVLLMLSNGGLADFSEAKRIPIELLESGPAAGAIAGAHYGTGAEELDLLAFDMGGTTAKICLVEAGQPAISHSFEAARRRRFAEGSGMPVRITTIDLIEIGAGGGSIASTDTLGLLKVGPRSADSEPGPACYGRGGQEPTVTDANLVLGYLNPEYFAGGSMRIDAGKAHEVMHRLGRGFGRDATSIAWGVHEIVTENMASAARVHVAERGRDPRDFVLLCTGGGGPVHAYNVARKIGIRTILCPPSAGVASAYGLLVASARADRSRTVNLRPMTVPVADLDAAYASLEADAAASLERLTGSFGPIAFRRLADGRFVGQGFNLSVRMPDGPYVASGHGEEDVTRTRLVAAFVDAYREKFGRAPPDVQVELVNLRVTAEAGPRRPFTPSPLTVGKSARLKGRRLAYFAEAGRTVETPVYERAALAAGFEASGPLLIEDPGSTLVVGPGGRIRQLPGGCIRVEIGD